jgi:hypothetical protein
VPHVQLAPHAQPAQAGLAHTPTTDVAIVLPAQLHVAPHSQLAPQLQSAPRAHCATAASGNQKKGKKGARQWGHGAVGAARNDVLRAGAWQPEHVQLATHAHLSPHEHPECVRHST